MLIEFFGLPGSGKTTVAKCLCALLRQSGRPVLASHELMPEDIPKVRQVFQRIMLIGQEHLLGRPKGMRIGAIWRLNQASLKDRIKALYNALTVNAIIARAKRRDLTLVMDQGLFQAVFSSQLRANETDVEAALASVDFPMDLKIVTLGVDVDTIRNRLSVRQNNHSRLSSDTDPAISPMWQRAIALDADIRKLMDTGAYGKPLTLTTNSVPPEQIAQKIADQLT